MPIYVSFCPFGLFAYDEKGKILDQELFSKDAAKAAKVFASSQKTELSEEEKILIERLKRTRPKEKIMFEVKKSGFEHEFPNAAGENLRRNLEKVATDAGFVKSGVEARKFIQEMNYELTTQKMRTSFGADALIIQAAGAIDELDKALNIGAMRLREWYGIYWPELIEKVADNEKFCQTVSQNPARPADKASIGAALENVDVEKLRDFAKMLASGYEERHRLEKYVEERAKANMLNLIAVAGPLLVARLLAAAGSLENLAKMPSSTIQILGAEKSLFRYLRGRRAGKEGKAPKYGLIFAHSTIQAAPADKKGQAARQLAAKISLAAKTDFYRQK